MSKSIVLVDTPAGCWGCDLAAMEWIGVDEKLDKCYAYCCGYHWKDVKQYCLNKLLDINVQNLNRAHNPKWCPAKEIPTHITDKNTFAIENKHMNYQDGYNTCLDEILKGEQR